MAIRGIRGAITVDENTKEEVLSRTCELLESLIKENFIQVEDIASVFFSATDDVDAEFPAVAARKLGWIYTPLICMREMSIPGSLQSCVRILLHLNTDKKQEEMVHVYLRGAQALRPDLNAEAEGCGKYKS